MPQKEEKQLVVPEEQVKEVSVFEKKANKLEIKSRDDMEKAAELLGSIKKMQKHMKSQETEAKSPFQKLVKGITETFKPISYQLSSAEQTIKDKVISFQREEAKIAEEKKAKIEARVGEGRGKLKVETAINQVSDVESARSAKHTSTATSSMTTRMIKKCEITDEALIPREFLVVDSAKVKAAAIKIYDLEKEGVTVEQIPGVRVYEEESISAR